MHQKSRKKSERGGSLVPQTNKKSSATKSNCSKNIAKNKLPKNVALCRAHL